jgi:hypothetical protein
MECPEATINVIHAINVYLLHGVNKSTDNLLVGCVFVTYESACVTEGAEVYVVVVEQPVCERKCNNSCTINEECSETIVCINIAESTKNNKLNNVKA